jgi:hypothetical protein
MYDRGEIIAEVIPEVITMSARASITSVAPIKIIGANANPITPPTRPTTMIKSNCPAKMCQNSPVERA